MPDTDFQAQNTRLDLRQALCKRIAAERVRRESATQESLFSSLIHGNIQAAVEDLVFFTPPDRFPAAVTSLEQRIQEQFHRSSQSEQEYFLDFMFQLVISLRSLLPRWTLQDTRRFPAQVLTDTQLELAGKDALELMVLLAHRAPAAADRLLARYQEETTARYRAEQSMDPEQDARRLVGSSLAENISSLDAEIQNSHLRLLSEMRFDGKTLTELSNDYAAYLQHTLYLGASFATTNPPLVNLAWAANPRHWNRVADALIQQHTQASLDDLAKWMTLEVVLSQMLLLRPVFLVSAGLMGCVCLQVAPTEHSNSQRMVNDALFFFDELTSRLEGGVPNVVFKLPGTQAGLEACRQLTSQGIGVVITVGFSLFQHEQFLDAILKGNDLFSCLVVMNGRLAFPVRDELLTKKHLLEAEGISEIQVRQAAAWAGVAVARRLQRLVKARGADPQRVKILIASLRIYQGEGYEQMESAFPDITGVTGVSLLSVFPNIRRPFDHRPLVELDPANIDLPLPEPTLQILAHSEMFRQAYYSAAPGFASADQRFLPEQPLHLADQEAVVAWPPVNATLNEFIKSYQLTLQRFQERIDLQKNNSNPTHQSEDSVTDFQTAQHLLTQFKGPSYLYGEHVLPQVGQIARCLGRRAALIGDNFPGSPAFIQSVKDSLAKGGIELVGEIPGAAPNAPREDLARIQAALDDLQPELVISFGGGSTIDAAKAAIVLHNLGGSIEDYFGTNLVTQALTRSARTLLPHLAIQTAASSAAHLTKYSNITDIHTGQKKLVVDNAIVPARPVFDYTVTYSAPPGLTADGALDGIAHCLEVLYSAVGKPEYNQVEPVALEGIRLVVEYLPVVLKEPKNPLARRALAMATDLGGYCIMLGGTNGAHLTSFSLVDILSHGRATSMLNPYYTVFFAPAVEDALRKVGQVFRQAGYTQATIDLLHGRELGLAVAEAMIAFEAAAGLPTCLEQVPGFSEEHITRALAAAKNPQLKMKLENMPVPLTAETVDEYMGPVLYAARSGDLSLIKNVS